MGLKGSLNGREFAENATNNGDSSTPIRTLILANFIHRRPKVNLRSVCLVSFRLVYLGTDAICE